MESIEEAEWTAFEVLEFFTSTIPDLPPDVVSGVLEEALAGRMQTRLKAGLKRLLAQEPDSGAEASESTEKKTASVPPQAAGARRRSIANAVTATQSIGDEQTHLSKWSVQQVTDFLVALSFLFEEKKQILQDTNFNGAKLALATTESIQHDLGVDKSVARYVIAMVRRSISKVNGPPIAAPLSSQRTRAQTVAPHVPPLPNSRDPSPVPPPLP